MVAPARPRSLPLRIFRFWSSDNFYDRTGETTKKIFGQLSLATKAKPLLTVAGNHDYWVLGGPGVGTTEDQFANGHMQYYGQDTKASEGVSPASTGAAATPLNFSSDPHAGHVILGGNLPAIENSFLCRTALLPHPLLGFVSLALELLSLQLTSPAHPCGPGTSDGKRRSPDRKPRGGWLFWGVLPRRVPAAHDRSLRVVW